MQAPPQHHESNGRKRVCRRPAPKTGRGPRRGRPGRRRHETPRHGTTARIAGLLAGLLIGIAAGPAAATHLDGYVWDFEGGTLPYEWSGSTNVTQTDFLPDNYLLVQEGGTAQLFGLDYVDYDTFTGGAYVAFDLLLGSDWRGNEPGFESYFQLLGNGSTVMNTTFSVYPGTPQSYPDLGPGGDYPAGTGSEAFSAGSSSRYHINVWFGIVLDEYSCCTHVLLEFSSNVAGGAPGLFAIDNVVVSAQPIPEPTTGTLLLLGMAALAARQHRKAPEQGSRGSEADPGS
jgi:hypothetical protein